MVGLVGIVQVDLLFKQSQRVSNEEMSHVLGQEMIDACRERSHHSLQSCSPCPERRQDSSGSLKKGCLEAQEVAGLCRILVSPRILSYGVCSLLTQRPWGQSWGPRDRPPKSVPFAKSQDLTSIWNLKL